MFCADAAALQALLRQWADRAAYGAEHSLLVLRSVLTLLTLNDVATAEGLATGEVRKDPDAADLRLWAAYFLAESARAGDLDAFNFCVTKFTVALRSDATFRVMLTKVREVVFGQSAPSGIFGLMSKMLDG